MAKRKKKEEASAATAAAPAPTQGVQKAPQLLRRPDFQTFYVNHTGLLTTTFDVSLVGGRILAAEGGQLMVEQFLQLTMSYQHAKAIGTLLLEQVEQYEKTNGIDLPFKPRDA
jgi:hypothetical protein